MLLWGWFCEKRRAEYSAVYEERKRWSGEHRWEMAWERLGTGLGAPQLRMHRSGVD